MHINERQCFCQLRGICKTDIFVLKQPFCSKYFVGPPVEKDGCQLGKFATVVKMTFPDQDTVARQLCQQIVGMNPKEVGEWSPQEVQQKEPKKKKDKKAQEGEIEQKVEIVPESRLLDQEFLLGSGTVRSFLKDSGPQIVDFVRLECGEDLGEDD